MGKIELLTPIIKGLNSSGAGVTGGYAASNGGRGGRRSPPSDASARMSSIYPYSHIYICRLGLLALPVFRVGGLAYVYSFGNATYLKYMLQHQHLSITYT